MEEQVILEEDLPEDYEPTDEGMDEIFWTRCFNLPILLYRNQRIRAMAGNGLREGQATFVDRS